MYRDPTLVGAAQKAPNPDNLTKKQRALLQEARDAATLGSANFGDVFESIYRQTSPGVFEKIPSLTDYIREKTAAYRDSYILANLDAILTHTEGQWSRR